MQRAAGYRKLLFVAGIVMTVVAWSLAGGDRAYAACAQAPDSSYQKDADLVATGTVENVEVAPESSRVEVSVERVYKGESGSTLYVTTDSGSARAVSTDVRFEAGAEYLLYLTREGDELKTSACDGTRELSRSSTGVPVGLGEGELPDGADEASGETLPETGGVALIGAPLVLASAVFAVWVRHRRRL